MATAMTYDYITIQASHSGITPVIEAKQGDSGRGVIINITDMDLTGMTALAYVKKPDDKKVFNNASINDDGQVVVDFTAQMLAVVGIAILEVEILQGARRVTTFIIKIDVKKSEIDGSAIESADEFGVLETAIANAQTATNEANTAAEYANFEGREAFIQSSNAERAAAGATAAAGNANAGATAANNAAASANAGATAANEAATNANLAAAVANTASAYIRTEEMPFELANIEAWTSGSTNVLIQKATKTGNIITIDVHGKVTAAMGEWSEAFQVKEAFNALPVSWRKTINDQIFLSTYINGGLCGQAYINGARDSAGIMTASGGFWSRFRITGNTDTIPAGAEINIHGSWIVNGVINKIESTPIAVMTNALAAPAEKIIANIEPVQEGTGDPSPDNVRPISGWTGVRLTRSRKNLLNYTPAQTSGLMSGIAWTFNGGVVSLSGTASANVNVAQKIDTSTTGVFNCSGDYILSGCPTGGSSSTYGLVLRIATPTGGDRYVYDYGDGVNFTVTDGERITRVYVNVKSGTDMNGFVFRPMVCFASDSDNAFEPYSADEYPITWLDIAGTIYGGTLDMTRGVLTVDREKKTFTGGSWQPNNRNGYTLYNVLPFQSNFFPTICNRFKPLTEFAGFGFVLGLESRHLYILAANEIAGVSDVNSWLTWLAANPLEIVVPLATPITYQLSPTEVQLLQGYNAVWADTGDVTVSYLIEE